MKNENIKNVLSVANAVLSWSFSTKIPINAGKLHKILVIAQYYHIGYLRVPLFHNPIVVEETGAFIPELYDYLGKFGCGTIHRKICIEDCLVIRESALLKRTLTPIPENLFEKSLQNLNFALNIIGRKNYEDLRIIAQKENNAYHRTRKNIGIGAEIPLKEIYCDFHKTFHQN